MAKTRLMQVLFSAVEEGDEKLTNMVGEDIRTAINKGNAEDEQNGLSYEHKGDGIVAITDKETGEVTMANRDPEGSEDEFELWTPDEQIEGFVHPEGDGVTPGQQQGAPDEHAEDHLESGSIAEQPEAAPVEEKAQEGVCPECGKEPCECKEEEAEKEFSISSDNTALMKVFSKQELVERVYSEVIESEETSNVGDLKFEKVPEENAVVVTDVKTGHQVKVTLDDENLEVTELESKNFNDEAGDAEGEFDGIAVIGLDADNHQLVEAHDATEEGAAEAIRRFEENGCIGVQAFEDMEEAAEYANNLISHLGGDIEEEAEVEEKEFSDGSTYYARTFSTSHSNLMYRMFSESVACNGECPDEEIIKDALKDGEEVEVESDVIIPIRENLGLIHDTENDEYTKVEIDEDGDLTYEKIDAEKADELRADEAEKEGEEKDFSVYSNEDGTRLFSENETLTEYMVRLFSEEASEDEIIEAIEGGNQVEKDKEIITPIDEETAIIEDKENGEFTKAIVDDEKIDLSPITEEEADELTKDLVIEEEAHDAEENEDAEEGEEEEKKFTHCNEAGTRLFSEEERFTEYMVRLFSEEADEEEIAKAIEDGKVINNESEIITPIDKETAIVEDKENGEFTKAVLEGEEAIDVEPIDEEEAKKLIDAANEKAEEEKKYSVLNKFFADINGGQPAGEDMVQEVKLKPGQHIVIVDEEGNPVVNEEAAEDAAPSVEVIEDKALAAVQAIQEATAAAQQAIQEAKAAPAENQETPLQEATFSEQKNFSNTSDMLLTWLNSNHIG